jgi:hypothetical protein
MYVYHIFSIHLSVVGHLGCFKSLAIVNSAAINIGVQVVLSYPRVHSFDYIPSSCITRLYGGSIFKFLRDFHFVFYSGCTNLDSHQQCRSVPFFPRSQQHLLLFVLLMITILTGVRWNLNVVLICLSFMTKDVENFFLCLLTIYTSSFEICLFS